MARLYTNENFPETAVLVLRSLGHDVLTSLEAGNANARIPDDAALEFAHRNDRIFVTQDRVDFRRLHNDGFEHSGLVICTDDADFERLARHVDAEIRQAGDDVRGKLLRVYRG